MNTPFVFSIKIFLGIWIFINNMKTSLLPKLRKISLQYLIYVYIYVYIYSVLFFLHNCPLLIPIHNTAVLIKICRFLNNVVKFYANPYEIGPSNASQGQHGRSLVLRSLVGKASALDMPRTWVRVQASVCFLFVPLRPFFRAALAKRWKVQFRKGLHKFNNVDSKTTYFNENCCIM